MAPIAAPQPVSAPPLELQEKALRQQQQIQALIAQNDFLHHRVRELESAPPVSISETVPSTPAVEPPESSSTALATPPTVPRPVSTDPTPEPALMPNADGMIDLIAVLSQGSDGSEVNPFSVRVPPRDAVRELTLHIAGIIGGSSPCALINERAMRADETLESFQLVRVETAAVLLRHGAHLLRLPVAEKPARVRLPL